MLDRRPRRRRRLRRPRRAQPSSQPPPRRHGHCRLHRLHSLVAPRLRLRRDAAGGSEDPPLPVSTPGARAPTVTPPSRRGGSSDPPLPVCPQPDARTPTVARHLRSGQGEDPPLPVSATGRSNPHGSRHLRSGGSEDPSGPRRRQLMTCLYCTSSYDVLVSSPLCLCVLQGTSSAYLSLKPHRGPGGGYGWAARDEYFTHASGASQLIGAA